MFLPSGRVMGMWVCTCGQAHILELKIFGCCSIAFGSQKDFVAHYLMHPMQQNIQIYEEMSKICLYQVKGVMGMLVYTYDQFTFRSLRSFDIIYLSLHFNFLKKIFRCCFHSFLNCSKRTRNEEDMKFENKRILMFFFP